MSRALMFIVGMRFVGARTASALRVAAVLLPFALAGCGYHVAGKAELVPETVKTISIPAFANITTRYKLTDRLPEAISREFIARTHYRIVPDPNSADAVLRGSVVNYVSYPIISDPATGRSTGIEMHVILQVSLTERATAKVLFNRPNFEVRDRYEISTDPKAYFEESDAALDRVSQQVARQVVTSILENF